MCVALCLVAIWLHRNRSIIRVHVSMRKPPTITYLSLSTILQAEAELREQQAAAARRDAELEGGEQALQRGLAKLVRGIVVALPAATMPVHHL